MKKNKESVKEEVQENSNVSSDQYYLTNSYEFEGFTSECEEERKNVIKVYNSLRKRNNFIMVFVILIFVASFILLTQGTWGQITGWVLVGTSITGMLIYYILSRRQSPNLSKDYCIHFWQKSNDYLFNQEGFKDCYLDMKEKYDLSAVMADRVYENVIDIASRNLVHGKYHGKDFVFGELAFYKLGNKKNSKEVVFVGRHIEFENDLEIDGRIILNIRGEKQLDVPTDLSDLSVLEEDGNFFIYGPEGTNYKKVLGNDLINRFKDFNVIDPLLNLSIVFWHRRTAVYLSYDDSIVAIPFNSELVAASYASLKQNIFEVFDILLNPAKKKHTPKVKEKTLEEEKPVEEKSTDEQVTETTEEVKE